MNVSNDPFSDEFSGLDRCGFISYKLIEEADESVLDALVFDISHLLCFSRDVACALTNRCKCGEEVGQVI